MKLFVVDPDFEKSAILIEKKKRLFNMLIVTRKFIDIFENQPPNAYNGSPHYRCWAGYLDALKYYSNCILRVCKDVHHYNTKYQYLEVPDKFEMPPFTEKTFLSHQAFLVNLDPELYNSRFEKAINYNGGVLVFEYYVEKDGEKILIAEDRNGFFKENKQKYL